MADKAPDRQRSAPDRPADAGPVDPAVRSYVADARVGHLATADASGSPFVVPVCFVLLGSTIYSILDEKPKRTHLLRLRRVRNVVENPRAALVVDRYDEDWSRIGFALLRGPARLVEPGAEHAEALVALRSKYAQYRSMRLDDRPALAIDVAHVATWGALTG